MIQSFSSAGTEDVFNGQDTREARQVCPRSAWSVAQRKLDQLNNATTLQDLRVPPGNHLEALAGGRAGQHSVRINQQYRLCFEWSEEGARNVELVDYH